jgi:3-oxoacyl-[acyl-carrier-protein] synthase-1
MIEPVAITAYTCISAAGDGVEALWQALVDNRCRLSSLDLFELPFETVVGAVKTPLPEISERLAAYRCRNARLALRALNQDGFRARVEDAMDRYRSQRVGLVLGTSTSGIYDSEAAYARFLETSAMPSDFHFMRRHAAQATAEFLALELGLAGPSYAISTACSSSAKALAAGQRLISAGVCDAVLVAGVDTLCRLTLRGFHSLELIDPQPCRPMDSSRRGINIGEGAGLLLLERRAQSNAGAPFLLAVGESSDAHHMSAPHPDGAGAARAMAMALEMAGISPEAVDYINLHATATPLNDQSEARAVTQVFPKPPPCSGVKGLLGHTLGAAGAVEAVVSLLALERGLLPGTCGFRELGVDSAVPVLANPRADAWPRHVLSNAFGFGGNNASVLLRSGRA